MNEVEVAKQETTFWLATATEATPLVAEMEIKSDADQEFAASVLRDVKETIRALEERRKEITVPLNAALNSVNSLFRPAREAHEQLEKSLKLKIVAYLDRKNLANRAALELAAKAEQVEDAQQALALVDQSGPPQGVSVRHVWKFEIVRPDDVPLELWSPDPEKIGAWIKQQYDKLVEGEQMIPGVRLFKEPIVTSRKVG